MAHEGSEEFARRASKEERTFQKEKTLHEDQRGASEGGRGSPREAAAGGRDSYLGPLPVPNPSPGRRDLSPRCMFVIERFSSARLRSQGVLPGRTAPQRQPLSLGVPQGSGLRRAAAGSGSFAVWEYSPCYWFSFLPVGERMVGWRPRSLVPSSACLPTPTRPGGRGRVHTCASMWEACCPPACVCVCVRVLGRGCPVAVSPLT